MASNNTKIKIGIDVHGVLDDHQGFFKTLCHLLVDNGHEVHIITGAAHKDIIKDLERLDIPYTHLFSITDHHVTNGVDVTWDEKGEPHLDAYLWDKTKAEYCMREKIDLHFDDSDIYNYFFKTPYARFYSKNSHRSNKTQL